MQVLARRRIRLTIRLSFGLLILVVLATTLISLLSVIEADQHRREEVLKRRLQQAVKALEAANFDDLWATLGDAAQPPGLVPAELVQPFTRVSTDSPLKALSEAKTGGCRFIEVDNGTACVAVEAGHDAQRNKGPLLVIGQFQSGELRPFAGTAGSAHRLRVDVTLGRRTASWSVPVLMAAPKAGAGEPAYTLSGYPIDAGGTPVWRRPVFKGTLDRGDCVNAARAAEPGCPRQWTYALSLPLDELNKALAGEGAPAPGHAEYRVRVLAVAPGATAQEPFFDTARYKRANVLNNLEELLDAGEVLSLAPSQDGAPAKALVGRREIIEDDSPRVRWAADLARRVTRTVVEWVASAAMDPPQAVQETAGQGHRQVTLALRLAPLREARPRDAWPGGGSAVELSEPAELTANLLLWSGSGMLFVVLVVWTVIEWGVLRRVLRLTERAARAAQVVRDHGEPEGTDFSDLRGTDELGLLASSIDGLLARIAADVRRQEAAFDAERSVLRGISHELRSPLQALQSVTAGHPAARSLIARMTAAFNTLYGSSSVAEGVQRAAVELVQDDLVEFAAEYVESALRAGFSNVGLVQPAAPVIARFDETLLGDVLDKIVANADRYRKPGTPIQLEVWADASSAYLSVSNEGPHIAPDQLDQIFELGVSDAMTSEQTGQGLFVVRSYLGKMGASAVATNWASGVRFVLTFPLDWQQAASH